MIAVALNAAGGLALFLLAMMMMTDGLKAFAGGGLKRLLGRWTSTPVRGVLAGVLVTGVAQSSSAVTVATIGFVNAGLLSLRQGLAVIFGTNVGTTVTGWLVSVVGFGFRIEGFALPILSVGVVLRLAAPGRRYQGLGEALTGFGLFFLGLVILKDALTGLTGATEAAVALGAASRPTFLVVGFVATVLTQSSSAAIALILTAAARGVVGMDAAAAAVIGANLGTTSTAAFAVIRATPSAKRLALGHIAFNLVTGVVALALLPLLLWLVEALADRLHVEGSPAAVLALFHTVFNMLGVALMLPLAGHLAGLLERLFRNAEEDLARPQHLDATLASTPDLAVAALHQELQRLHSVVLGGVHAALSETGDTLAVVERRAAAVRSLGAAVAEFSSGVRTQSLPAEVADDLVRSLRIARYLDEATRLVPRVTRLRLEGLRLADAATRTRITATLALADRCIAIAARAPDHPSLGDDGAGALAQFEGAYQETKESLLSATVVGRLSIETADELLDAFSATRRMVEQMVKADRLLRSAGAGGHPMDGDDGSGAELAEDGWNPPSKRPG